MTGFLWALVQVSDDYPRLPKLTYQSLRCLYFLRHGTGSVSISKLICSSRTLPVAIGLNTFWFLIVLSL